MADWALILGSSSGFGEASALGLARAGFNIFGVHFDRKATLANADRIVAACQAEGVECEFFNINAADEERRTSVIDRMAEKVEGTGDQVRVLLHSLAFGTLKPYFGTEGKAGMSRKEMEMTLDVMGHSIVYWTQDLVNRGLMREGGRIYGMTSTGDAHAWRSYGAVSAAKAVLEAHIRQIAFELAPRGITANSIRAGVTDTPALRKIPGSDAMINAAAAKNPHGRLTRPEDVAAALVSLVTAETQWITGNVIGVDGGEEIAG